MSIFYFFSDYHANQVFAYRTLKEAIEARDYIMLLYELDIQAYESVGMVYSLSSKQLRDEHHPEEITALKDAEIEY